MAWMQTHSGRRFYPEDVAASGFCIEDIAHALSHLCRFGGHSKRFYSVAQHSVLVSHIVASHGGSLELQLWGLLHDASEAYMVDVPTPVKAILKGYKEKEHEVMLAIAKALEMPKLAQGKLPNLIKRADHIALVTEAGQLVNGDVSEWELCKIYKPIVMRLPQQNPKKARTEFLERWEELRAALAK